MHKEGRKKIHAIEQIDTIYYHKKVSSKCNHHWHNNENQTETEKIDHSCRDVKERRLVLRGGSKATYQYIPGIILYGTFSQYNFQYFPYLQNNSTTTFISQCGILQTRNFYPLFIKTWNSINTDKTEFEFAYFDLHLSSSLLARSNRRMVRKMT